MQELTGGRGRKEEEEGGEREEDGEDREANVMLHDRMNSILSSPQEL